MTPFWQTTNGTIRTYVGDSLALLREMASESVHCCVTSPPYFGLRDYGVDGQIGLEPSPEEFVRRLVEVFSQVRRVLHPSGVCWVNMGDSYNAHHGQRKTTDNVGAKQETNCGSNTIGSRYVDGIKPKDLIGVPWLLAFALRADGWYLRQDIIWHKPAPMPESVTDRCTKAHEYVFLLTKSARYFYDAEAVKEAGSGVPWNSAKSTLAANGIKNVILNQTGQRRTAGADTHHDDVNQTGRNRRSVWTVASEPFPGSHFATFPSELIRPMIRAGSSEWGCCPKCLAPWVRVVERFSGRVNAGPKAQERIGSKLASDKTTLSSGTPGTKATRGWQPTCECWAGEPIPATILDPFGGSGTTGMVARQEGRACIMLELNPEYAAMHRERVMQIKVMTEDDAPLFSKEFA